MWYPADLSVLKEQCLANYNLFKVTGLDYYKELRSRYRNESSQAKRAYHCNRFLHVKEVYSAIFSHSNSVSLDVYCINKSVLKLAAPHIVEVLAYLFNLYIDNSIFPGRLNLSKVAPLFKKGVRTEYTDYRPVSIIPVIAKVFEILLNAKLIKYFENNLLSSEDQYSFRGTTNAIVSFMKMCVTGLDEKKVLGGWYGMSKAFDTISHDILISKLSYYGFN